MTFIDKDILLIAQIDNLPNIKIKKQKAIKFQDRFGSSQYAFKLPDVSWFVCNKQTAEQIDKLFQTHNTITINPETLSLVSKKKVFSNMWKRLKSIFGDNNA